MIPSAKPPYDLSSLASGAHAAERRERHNDNNNSNIIVLSILIN